MAASIVARADLLRAILALPQAERSAVARSMGDELAPADRGQVVVEPPGPQTPLGPEPVPDIRAQPLAPATFWQPFRFATRPPVADAETTSGSTTWRGRSEKPPIFNVLAPWRELEPRLRKLLAVSAPGTDIDADRAVEALSQGRPLAPLPLRRREDWPRRIDVVVDRSDRLIPFWRDQDLLVAALKARLQGPDIRVARFDESMDTPQLADGVPYAAPAGGGVVPVLGDLGCLDAASRRPMHQWRRFATDLRLEGRRRPSALLTAPLSRCPPALRRSWHIAPWETPGPDLPQDETAREARALRLLGFLTGAVRVEPGLLRAVRRAMPAQYADIGTESDVWQHKAFRSRHCIAATPDKAECDRIAPPDLTDAEWSDVWRRVVSRRQEWRYGCRDEVWFLEVLGLPEAVRAALLKEDCDDARAFFRALRDHPVAIAEPALVDLFLDEAARRAGCLAWTVPEFERVVGARAALANPSLLPDGRDPRGFGPVSDERTLRIHQVGGGVLAMSGEEAPPDKGSPIAALRCGHLVAQLVASELPAWTDDSGEDRYGRWVSFTVTGPDGARVTQRMRWISPGRFMMGSPRTEEGQYDEGPIHEVAIGAGFWMFETACAEALWEAVTGHKPQTARGAKFPVTTVSWGDARDFVRRLNALRPGLDLSLPSEAQWEYACRAGTTTAYNFGNSISPNFVRYRSKDPVEVGSLPPNGWGLSEMHGNVWEWCEDDWHDGYEGAPGDGSAWIDAPQRAAGRVIRGGSWNDGARDVRAACRLGGGPGNRNYGVGFRCARVQTSGATSEAEQGEAALASRASAERARPQAPTSEAPLLRPGNAEPTVLPSLSTVIIRTDREETWLRRLGLADPDFTWASAAGRDEFGLFADFSALGADIEQRLRWIPPGRFLMGSSDDEAGRWEDEGLRHEVTVTEGFWLFDTPCTQALWQAVMGENPSRFVSPTRPVEQVSWDDAKDFIARINERLPGLDLSLPSEAQWEYACRAGAATATYAGEMKVVGEHNAPVLDAIAWYGGNSGVDFELDDGIDSSGWREKQHAHTRAGTRPVAQKRPNAWGLYDMLGNVSEWCEDDWHGSYEGAPADGSAWIDAPQRAANRVFRGGSWYNEARDVRAACRFGGGPGSRNDGVGFRCARVQSSGERSKRGERSEQAATTAPGGSGDRQYGLDPTVVS